jgi:hypothetical protein
MNRAAVLAALLLAGTVHAESFSPTRDDRTMTMTIVLGTPANTLRACSDVGAHASHLHEGCAVTDVIAHTCTIYVVRPSGTDDTATEVVGHEALHCFFGKYHARPD